MSVANNIRTWLLAVPLVPSVIVAIFNLYHIFNSSVLRTALNNHTIILLLIFGLLFELTDAIWYIYYFHTGTIVSTTTTFCRAWVYINPATLVQIYLLMAWASVERHILIFHSNWFATARKRLLFHYFPLTICILWPMIFYFITLFILPCDIPINYGKRMCNLYSCVYSIRWIGIWDSIVHYIMPTFITVISSVTLLIRVMYQKYRVHQRIDWRNYKKMVSQLLPVALLHILLSFPIMILYAMYSAGIPRTIAADYYSDGLFFSYWAILFTPFASVLSLPDLKTKCLTFLLIWQKTPLHNLNQLSMVYLHGERTATVSPVVV